MTDQDTGSLPTVIVYDGMCHLCSGSMAWLAHRVPKDRLKFTPVQSAEGAHGTQAAADSAWPVSSAATPLASPAPIPAAVDQAAASSSPIRQLDRDEVAREAWRGMGDDVGRRWLHGRCCSARPRQGTPALPCSSARPTIRLNWNTSAYAVPSRALRQRGLGTRRRNSSAPSKRSSDLSCWQNATTDRWADCPFPNETRRVKR